MAHSLTKYLGGYRPQDTMTPIETLTRLPEQQDLRKGTGQKFACADRGLERCADGRGTHSGSFLVCQRQAGFARFLCELKAMAGAHCQALPLTQEFGIYPVEWTDAMLQDEEPMDRIHREFVELLALAQTATDNAVARAWSPLLHFEPEENDMRQTCFCAADGHMLQHRVALNQPDARRLGQGMQR